MLEKADKGVVWSSASQQDLVELGAYLTLSESRNVADKVVNDTEDAGERLSYQALLWRIRDNVSPDARFVIAHAYVIVYVVDKDTVTILRVVRGARDIEAIFHTDDNPRL